MNTKPYFAAFVTVLSLVLANGAFAAVSDTGTADEGISVKYDSTDLLGAPVKNTSGDLVGLINRLEIDSGGHVFAVLNHGSYDLYGEGGGFTPVPFEALQISEARPGQIQVVMNTDEKALASAPFYDPTKTGDPRYEAQIYQYYGLQPYWAANANCMNDLQDLAKSKTGE